jgi:RNA polymerase sigma-70 factor, ECF subfamily
MPAAPDFTLLLDAAARDLRAWIGALVRDPAAREDIFQETVRTLWVHRDRYEPSRPFGAWARGIATLKVHESRRQHGRFPIPFPPETITALQDAWEETEAESDGREAALQCCIEELPPRSRELLRLHYEERRTGPQIAAAMRQSVAAIHQTFSRLRRKLDACIRARLAASDEPVPVVSRHES